MSQAWNCARRCPSASARISGTQRIGLDVDRGIAVEDARPRVDAPDGVDRRQGRPRELRLELEPAAGGAGVQVADLAAGPGPEGDLVDGRVPGGLVGLGGDQPGHGAGDSRRSGPRIRGGRCRGRPASRSGRGPRSPAARPPAPPAPGGAARRSRSGRASARCGASGRRRARCGPRAGAPARSPRRRNGRARSPRSGRAAGRRCAGDRSIRNLPSRNFETSVVMPSRGGGGARCGPLPGLPRRPREAGFRAIRAGPAFAQRGQKNAGKGYRRPCKSYKAGLRARKHQNG